MYCALKSHMNIAAAATREREVDVETLHPVVNLRPHLQDDVRLAHISRIVEAPGALQQYLMCP